MAVLDKLKFWKKKSPLEELESELKTDSPGVEPFDFGSEQHGFGTTSTSMSEIPEPPAFSSQPDPVLQRPMSYQPPDNSKDIQIILSKLDAIQARMENMDRRLQIIEEVAVGEQKKQKNEKQWY